MSSQSPMTNRGRARQLGVLLGNERLASSHFAALNKSILRAGVAGSSCQDISTMGPWAGIIIDSDSEFWLWQCNMLEVGKETRSANIYRNINAVLLSVCWHNDCNCGFFLRCPWGLLGGKRPSAGCMALWAILGLPRPLLQSGLQFFFLCTVVMESWN